VQQDPGIQTFVARNATPGHPLEFTVSGTGSMPREAQGGAQGGPAQGDATGQAASGTPNGPGGGIGEPINTPDPLSKYKWWILGILALLLAAAAAFMLRKPATLAGAVPATVSTSQPFTPSASTYAASASPGVKNANLLNALKEELFALESEKIHGTITPAEYAEVKPALEIVLKRALKRNS